MSCSRRFSRQNHVVLRRRNAAHHLESGKRDRLSGKLEIENVMVKRTVVQIVEAACSECIEPARLRVQRQIVQGKDLIEVRQIVLTDIALEIIEEVGKRGDGSPMIEIAFITRDRENQRTLRFKHSPPFRQSPQWIGDVLETIR